MGFRGGPAGSGTVAFGPPTGQVGVGNAEAEGGSPDATRADHVHAFPAAAAGAGSVASRPGDTEQDGTAGTASRSDHRHSREALGTAGQIQPETYGAAAVAGATGAVADAGHVHAMPATPVTTWNTRSGAVTLAAADVEALFTAAGQILEGTGAGTGALIDLLAALEARFTAAGQVLVGTGAGTGALTDLLAAVEARFTAKGQLLAGTGAGSGELLAVGADGNVLTADSTQPGGVKWGVAGTSGVSSWNSRVGAVTLAEADLLAVFGAKGGLRVGTGAGTGQELAVGTNGQVLGADSSQTPGVRWTSPVGGLVAAQVLGAAAASVTFSAIPATWTQLRLAAIARSSTAAEADNFGVQLNGDTAANYDVQGLVSTQSTTTSTSTTAATRWASPTGNTAKDLAAASATAGAAGRLRLELPGYAGTTFRKVAEWSSGYNDAATAPSDAFHTTATAAWRSTAAVSSLTLFPTSGANFVAGSSFSLHGLN